MGQVLALHELVAAQRVWHGHSTRPLDQGIPTGFDALDEELLDHYRPPDTFDVRVELSYEVEEHQALLFPVRSLIASRLLDMTPLLGTLETR